MNFLDECFEKISAGGTIEKKEAMKLYATPTAELLKKADEARKKFCGSSFDICTIINGKSGRCSEDCKFCAQSSFYKSEVEEYPLLDSGEIVDKAVYNYNKGILRYSIVTSGKRLSASEVDELCKTVGEIKKKCDIEVCVSAGLLDAIQFGKLKEAGVSRVHNNLETSERFFEKVCTTHTYQDKINSIKAAMSVGIKVCSGGIFGLGEDAEDRIDMAIEIRKLGVLSVPINILTPIPNTPFEHNKAISKEEIAKMIAVYRFLMPRAAIRLAGGRGTVDDKGRQFFMSGANAAISGDMLTTSGISIESDIEMINELGFRKEMIDG